MKNRMFYVIGFIFLLIGSSCPSLSYAAGGISLDPQSLDDFSIKIESIQKEHWFTYNMDYVQAKFTRFNKTDKREYMCLVRLFDQKSGEKVIKSAALRKNQTEITLVAYANENWDRNDFYYDTHYIELPYYWDLK